MAQKEVLIIDYSKITDPKLQYTVRCIESKPHVRYIRYLMTKRYSPISIKQELFRLGLSAPHEPTLISYYLAVIDPVVKKFGLGNLYADYKNKLLRKNKRYDFTKDILNYRLHIGDNTALQVKFHEFIRYLEVDELWLNEIYKYHGKTENFPVDENGERILNVATPMRNLEKILTSEKRYLIDKMILENIPNKRIAQYCRENMKLNVNEYDIQFYKRMFFNVKTLSLEEKLKTLEAEKKSLQALLEDIDKGVVLGDADVGEKMLIRRQTIQRIEELNDNIKTLNMMYSEFAYNSAVIEQHDFEKMFTDVVIRAYKRFVELDQFKDRDVVEPQFKVARMMSFAHDKVEAIKSRATGITDRHSQAILLELYKKRIDEIMQQEVNRANNELAKNNLPTLEDNIDINEIAGVEELGINLIDDDTSNDSDKNKELV